MNQPAPLADRLRAGEILHLPARVTHARRGAVKHAFRYGVDYVLLCPETARPGALFGRNRWNLFAVHDRDHGGPRAHGRGAQWAWDQLDRAGLKRTPEMVLALMTQPRFLGYGFNPVSFWMLLERDSLRAVIAEVNNTFGQRHSYLCAAPGFATLHAADTINAQKVFHVSPFQDVAGSYAFRFDLTGQSAAILIRQTDGPNGLIATMKAPLRRLGAASLLAAALRRPGGALRVVALIYWHALRLRLKGLRYRPLPPAPNQEITR